MKCLLIINIEDESLQLKFFHKEHTFDEILEISKKKKHDAVAMSKIFI